MRYFLWLTISASISLLLQGCSLQQEMEVELPAHESVTLIECYLTPDMPMKALATQSLGFFEETELLGADELNIRLYHQGQTYPLAEVIYVDSVRHVVYNYLSTEDTVRYQEGDTWEMVVSRGEEEIARASTRFLPKPEIEEIQYTLTEDSIISLSIKLADPPEQRNYYRIMLSQPDSPHWVQFDGVWTDQFAQNGELAIHIGPYVKLYGIGLTVRVDHLEESYYDFLYSLDKANASNYNPFAQPANLESNLVGKAVGIFTAISRTTEQLEIDYNR